MQKERLAQTQMSCSFDGKKLKRKYAVLNCEGCCTQVTCCLECVADHDACAPCEPDVKRAKKEHTSAYVHEQVAAVGYCFLPEHTSEYGPHEWFESKENILERTIKLNVTLAADHTTGEHHHPRVGKLVSREFVTDLGADADEIAAKFDEWVARDGPNKNHMRNTLAFDKKADALVGPYPLIVFLIDNEARLVKHVEKCGFGFSNFEHKQFNVAAVTVVDNVFKSEAEVPEEVALAAVYHAQHFMVWKRATFFAHWK